MAGVNSLALKARNPHFRSNVDWYLNVTDVPFSPSEERVQVEILSARLIPWFALCQPSSGGDWWELGGIR